MTPEQWDMVEFCAAQLAGQPEDARAVLLGIFAVVYADLVRRDHPEMPEDELLLNLRNFLLALARRDIAVRAAGGAHAGTA